MWQWWTWLDVTQFLDKLNIYSFLERFDVINDAFYSTFQTATWYAGLFSKLAMILICLLLIAHLRELVNFNFLPLRLPGLYFLGTVLSLIGGAGLYMVMLSFKVWTEMGWNRKMNLFYLQTQSLTTRFLTLFNLSSTQTAFSIYESYDFFLFFGVQIITILASLYLISTLVVLIYWHAIRKLPASKIFRNVISLVCEEECDKHIFYSGIQILIYFYIYAPWTWAVFKPLESTSRLLIENQFQEMYTSNMLGDSLNANLLKSSWSNWIGFCFHLSLCVVNFSWCLYFVWLYYRRLYVHYFHLLSTFPDYLSECCTVETGIEEECLRVDTAVELYRIFPLDLTVEITEYLFPLEAAPKISC